MKRNLKLMWGATKVGTATLRYQPNRSSTAALLLSPEELPRSGWAVGLQQDMPTHSFDKGKHPEIERSKSIKSTTSRRLFKDASDSGSIFIQVTPLANVDDAESLVASASERVERNMRKLIGLNDFRDVGSVSVPSVKHARSMEYSMTMKDGLRSTLAVAANANDVYVQVTCSFTEKTWTLDDVIEIMRLQIEKIRAVKGTNI